MREPVREGKNRDKTDEGDSSYREKGERKGRVAAGHEIEEEVETEDSE